MSEYKEILVTGCAGFIGARVAEMLLEHGLKVIGIDNFDSYYSTRLKKNRLESLSRCDRFEFHQTDIEHIYELEALFQQHEFSHVLNLAGRAGVRRSIEVPMAYLKTNTCGVLNILDCCRKYEVNNLFFASSSSVYAGQPSPFSEGQSVDAPISPYAASKVAGELIAHTYHHLYRMNIITARFFTVYGPAGRPDMSVLSFIHDIANDRPIKVYGDGTQRRDWTYIDDIAQGVIASMNLSGFEIINLGGGRTPVSLNRVIELIELNLKKKAIVERSPFHGADMNETWADISKAREMLGWLPTIDIDEGIHRTVKWYLKNRHQFDGTFPCATACV